MLEATFSAENQNQGDSKALLSEAKKIKQPLYNCHPAKAAPLGRVK